MFPKNLTTRTQDLEQKKLFVVKPHLTDNKQTNIHYKANP